MSNRRVDSSSALNRRIELSRENRTHTRCERVPRIYLVVSIAAYLNINYRPVACASSEPWRLSAAIRQARTLFVFADENATRIGYRWDHNCSEV